MPGKVVIIFHSGSIGSVTPEMTASWKETSLPTILSRYELKDVYNADEFGLGTCPFFPRQHVSKCNVVKRKENKCSRYWCYILIIEEANQYVEIFNNICQTSCRCGAFGATSIGRCVSLDVFHCVACYALWLTSMTVPHFAYGLQFEDPQNSGCG